MPAVTVEADFVTNAADDEHFDTTFNALIEAIADGIETVMGQVAKIDDFSLPFVFVPSAKRGEYGERVRWIQQRLMRHNALPGG